AICVSFLTTAEGHELLEIDAPDPADPDEVEDSEAGVPTFARAESSEETDVQSEYSGARCSSS
ncbi:MAG: hypothetical protein Q9198_010544, partial [Flavoplaca austrocitrina]